MAVLTASAVLAAGCANSESNQNKDEADTGSKPALTPKVGKRALDGCNLSGAREEIQRRILDGTSFTAPTFVDERKRWAWTFVKEDNKIILNPLVLKCGKDIAAYAGVVHPERMLKNENFDPVRIIRSDSNDAVLFSNVVEGDVIPAPTELRMKPKLLDRADGYDVVAHFTSADGTSYGSMPDFKEGDLFLPLPPPPPGDPNLEAAKSA